MGSYTDNLGLYKVNTETDGNDTFNIDTTMNDNWDIIDAFSKSLRVKTYTDVANMGISDENLSDTDFSANLLALHNYKGEKSNDSFLLCTVVDPATNLGKSISAKFKTDIGSSIFGYCTLIVMRYPRYNAQMIINISYLHNKNSYRCQFNYNSSTNITLSPFILSEHEEGFLPKSGGTLSGGIDFAANGADFNTDSWFAIGMDGESIRLLARKNGKNRLLYFNNNNYSLTDALMLWYYDDGNEHNAKIFGEHNKPSGSYTGNGSATSRTINVGGIGNIIIVTTGSGGMYIAFPWGAYGFFEDGNMKRYSNSKIMYGDGILTLSTTDFNNNGVNYYYRVL